MGLLGDEVAKVFVIYDTKYGNTRLVAEEIVEGIREAGEIETALSDVDGVDLKSVAGYDAILIGSPNHWGGPVGSIKKLIDGLGKLDLKARWVAVFDTYMKGNFEKAAKKMEKRVNEKVPGLKLIAPGLSVRVGDMKGPIAGGELPKCREFGRRIAAQLKSG